MHVSRSHFSLVLPIATALTVGGAASASGLIAYDGFNYPSGPNLYLANGGTGWSSPWYDIGALPTGVAPEGLSWSGLPTVGGSAFTAPFASADFTRYSRGIASYSAPNDTVYLSFLFRPNPGYGLGGGLAFGTWTNGMVVGVHPGTGMYGLSTPPGDASADTSVPMVQGTTALVVARVTKNVDATFTWSIYVDPTVGAPEPAVPGASMVTTLGLPQAVFIYNDGGFSTDEIRVGTTWNSVLGVEAPPCPGDLDGNTIVDGADLGMLLGAWGTPDADLNGDGTTDGADLGLLLASWGPCA
ncbi:MAG: hypothetical protein KDA22_08785 [Phycisphaerales bacterium]|nr:hypothetical protein [Phycisphaerales bacterium]